jgi:DMSO/TMAO reductase YedYZ molybdopterin-dependent catalytic subunit
MADGFISRGFVGRGRASGSTAARIPPGQHEVKDFPVLSAGPTPRVNLDRWNFSIEGLVRQKASWSWDEFQKLPVQDFVCDIHCVTKWTKLDTRWRGVSVDTLLEHVEIDPKAKFVTAFTIEGYTTNMPLEDIINGRAFVGYQYDGKALEPAHGGPARLVVPSLYLWKSAKWVTGLRFMDKDRSGFWESAGYNNHGDPWKEERYTGD